MVSSWLTIYYPQSVVVMTKIIYEQIIRQDFVKESMVDSLLIFYSVGFNFSDKQ